MNWLSGSDWSPLALGFVLGAALSTIWWLWRRRSLLGSYDKRRLLAEAESDRLRLRVSSLKSAESRADDLARDVDRMKASADRLSGLEAELRDQRAADELVADLEHQLATLQGRAEEATALESQVAKLKAEAARVEPLQTEIDELRDEADQLGIEHEALLAQHRQLEQRLEASGSAGRNGAGDQSLNGFEAVEQLPWHDGMTKIGTPGAAHHDDLKAVRGIGPRLEKTLNDIGIQTWEQVAALTADDVAKVAEAIATFPRRIEGDGWMDQAAELVERFPLAEPYDRPSAETLRHQD